MNISDLDYSLPEKLIAQTPLAERDGARLLYIDPQRVCLVLAAQLLYCKLVSYARPCRICVREHHPVPLSGNGGPSAA